MPEAREVMGIFFEDRAMPEESAPGIVARGGVEVGEAFVGFAALVGGRRVARLREQLVGEARGASS